MKAALVTGGGTGIGAAVARWLVADGYRVAVTGRRAEPLQVVADELDGLALPGDTGVEGDAAHAVAATVDAFGGLDTLVLAAGAGAGGTVAEQTLERWERVLRTNLTGPFLVARAALPHLRERGGSIVTVASVGGLRASPASAAYAASKAGLVMLTQCLALDHGPEGVRANCVCPGWVRTDMGDAAMRELDPDVGAAYARATRYAPLRRPADAGEVAAAVAWLVSPAASYVNGAVLTVDGGLSTVDAGTLEFSA